jgi:hypothetical protein
MTFRALMGLVKEDYPDSDPFDKCVEGESLTSEAHLCGDTLVYTIASNLLANFDAEQAEGEQLGTAIDALTLLIEDLQGVCHGLRLRYTLQMLESPRAS